MAAPVVSGHRRPTQQKLQLRSNLGYIRQAGKRKWVWGWDARGGRDPGQLEEIGVELSGGSLDGCFWDVTSQSSASLSPALTMRPDNSSQISAGLPSPGNCLLGLHGLHARTTFKMLNYLPLWKLGEFQQG